jgi:hypothetical protein
MINPRGKVIGLQSYSLDERLHFGIATESINLFLAGAPALPGTPWARDPVVLPAEPAPTPFGGAPEDVTVGAADLGSGWTLTEQTRDAANAWTTGGLRVTLRHADGRIVRGTTWIVRTREQALQAWKSTRGGSLEICEASVYIDFGDGRVLGTCLVQNVIVEMTGAPYSVTRAALSAAAGRVTAAIKPQTSAPAVGLFKGSPSSVALSSGEVGPGWGVRETVQEQPNEYSTGRLRLAFQWGGAGSPTTATVEVEVFRDVQTADAAWNQARNGGGQAARFCDAAWVDARVDAWMLHCRQANVVIRVFAPSGELASSMLGTMLGRVRAGL